MQRYYSVLSLLLVFWASAVFQNVFLPFEFATLHRMHLVSTSSLAATTMGALAMFGFDLDDAPANRMRIAIAVLVLAIDLAFVVWCIVSAAPALKEWYVGFVGVAKGWGAGAVNAAIGCVEHPAVRKGLKRRRAGASNGSVHHGTV